MSTRRRFRLATIGLGAASAMVLSGCLSGGGSDNNSSGGESKGDGTVTILGAFGGAEKEAFVASLKEFESSSGITIDYTDDQDFATTIKAKVNSGAAPDIGLFPQPGGLLELSDDITPLGDVLDVNAIKSTLIPGFLEATTKGGNIYGAPMRMAVKSLVWYPKDAYDETGLSKEPASIQELQGITDKLKADTKAPWCMGWESDQATGWVGTDWLEEYVLRVNGPDVYDQWVKHEIPFNDPQIVKALDEFGKIAKTNGEVFGGAKGILNTGFADAMNPAFKAKPDCMLMRQGNFATGFFPDQVQADLDGSVGTFVFPPFQGGYTGQPILGGGDLAAAFNGGDSDVKQVMEFLTSDKFGGEWAAAGGWLSPHKTFDASQYADETTRNIATLAADADVFRFDASDLMPKEVGSGTFWTGMVDWVSGESSQKTLDAIEASWPKS
ncbi:carbohydrate ABC transporter substrate-binding protein [Aeromicrobium sp. A1-2]|uniref:ABC transporter substrate-binding protein n=1 Tax=Aeromicrobium sp. A1-2 TaxID=2107713 RepID=UPI000E543086|nr:ABC transporter substrate-binding protein [Aeromicrobium sp. A1-2]AXT86281.1 carbohydrate ABC transporter substrate-binding protein [Aeromicrobium sp. A1-2]